MLDEGLGETGKVSPSAFLPTEKEGATERRPL
jgi:hypothetical protein